MVADTGLKPRATTTPETIVVRGSIDCLARLPDGRVVILEIKTGLPREWHRQQLEWYLVAARSLFPGRPVEGLLLYA
jgi:RecB family exonuclease